MLSDKEKEELFNMLTTLQVAFNENVATERKRLYCELLEKYTLHDLKTAFARVLETNKRFPMIAEINQIISPTLGEDDSANEIVSEIIPAISQFGQYRHDDAKKHLSKESWGVVLAMGGWCEICKISYDEINTFRAQARNIAKVMVKRKQNGTLDQFLIDRKKSDTKKLTRVFEHTSLLE